MPGLHLVNSAHIAERHAERERDAAARRARRGDCSPSAGYAARRIDGAVAMKPLASLSLDLDNQWSYLKTHGDPGWESVPVVPRRRRAAGARVLARRGLAITFFIVGPGRRARAEPGGPGRARPAGHEIGNHSFHHEPWLHLYAERGARGRARPRRGAHRARRPAAPGRLPRAGLQPLADDRSRVLARRGYRYDASTLPDLPRAAGARLLLHDRRAQPRGRASERKTCSGAGATACGRCGPILWQLGDASLLEIPVTTLPLLQGADPPELRALPEPRLAARSRGPTSRARSAPVPAAGVQPSILLHPLDFLGKEDVPELAFFPAMGMARRASWRSSSGCSTGSRTSSASSA